MTKKIKVLIVDDSAVVRQTLADILSSDPQIEVMAVAADPFVAADKMRVEIPDVITLDVEMPRMDGLTFLHKIMSQHPIPVVMCSSLAESGSETVMKALEYGAVDVIQKPRVGTKQFLEESQIRICDTVKAAALSRTKRKSATAMHDVQPKLTADAVLEKPNSKAMIQTTEKVVVVGASTGGTEALRVFL
jgi:two-component system chemotaxis response regulator CheB